MQHPGKLNGNGRPCSRPACDDRYLDYYGIIASGAPATRLLYGSVNGQTAFLDGLSVTTGILCVVLLNDGFLLLFRS